MADAPRTISFARGAPSLDIVDVDGLRDSAVAAFTNDPGGVTGYGTSIGYPPLRRWIAAQHGVDEANVLVTNGSMQADAFLFETLVKPGDPVVVEKPTYDRTLLNLRSLGADVRMVSLQTDGIDTDELEALLESGLTPKLVHIIPNFQNPAGYTLSLAKRKELLELAHEHGFTIFEDDPYRHIRFSGEGIPTMLEMDEHDTVVYASSFSKTVCPGIRVGYLVARRRSSGRSRSSRRTRTSRRTWSPRRSSTSSASRARSTARSRPSRARSPVRPRDRRRRGGGCPRRSDRRSRRSRRGAACSARPPEGNRCP